MSLADDLRKLVSAGATVLDGLGQLEEAADAISARAGAVVEHMAKPDTWERVAVAAAAAAASTLGEEAARAATAPSSRAKPAAGPRAVRCDRHGTRAWRHTIVCANCRRVFQMADEMADRFAPEVCPCRSQLLPTPDRTRPEPFSARVCCSLCFLHACRHAGGRLS